MTGSEIGRSTETVRALVLAGGLGRRLQPVVATVPKPLAPVGGRPFLEYVLRQLVDQGIREVTLCIGHGGTAIRQFTDELDRSGLQISLSEESRPLGTAGALRLAVEGRENREFLVLNGDSFFDVRFDRLIDAHHGTDAEVTMAVRWTSTPGRFGSVSVDADGWVTAFREKVDEGPGLINGGIYMIKRRVLADLPLGEEISLEKAVFPQLIERANGRGIATVAFDGWFTDIGVPGDYRAVDEDPRPLVAALARRSTC
jgi:D-glycero-alpha-D-manno-heptose 1-phosphate guanylyltransferase